LSEAQLQYALKDVIFLHRIKDLLEKRLGREKRLSIAQACFKFLPYKATLDLMGWDKEDIFSHSIGQ